MRARHRFFGGILPCTYLIFAGYTAVGYQGREESGQKEQRVERRGLVVLDPEQFAELNLGSYEVRRGTLQDTKEYPVEIQFDPNRVAHLTPRVAGVVSEVRFGVGDRVEQGVTLAVLESRELGRAKSVYLAALARQGLGEKTYAREKRLWEKKISAEQDYLVAEKELQETRIEARMARESLLAMGVSEATLRQTEQNPAEGLNSYEMVAPFDGIITEQHITLGELLKDSSKAFVVVAPETVWAMARVYERDIGKIEPGLKAAITINAFPGETFSGDIDYVASQLDPETRTVVARVVLPNPKGRLRAGMFGKINLYFNQKQTVSDSFLVPHAALQRSKDGFVVFKEVGEGRFEQKTVRLVAKAADFAEVTGDLKLGDKLATGDIFILKSQAEKAAMGGGLSH